MPESIPRRVLWITITDRLFFPGTLAVVNSILHYHPGAQIAVVSSDQFNDGLSDLQARLLTDVGVRVYGSDHFARPGRVLGAWQLKAYAAADLACDQDMVIGIDSDAVLCSDMHDMIHAALTDGKLRGGRDGDGVNYDESYARYGFRVPARSEKYMSTSLYFVPLTKVNRVILTEWAACCNTAVFGPQALKDYPGHGDQGVFNSVVFKHCGDDNTVLLNNHLFSQHWVYEKDVMDCEGGRLVNRTVNQAQRVLHCGGTRKFWSVNHSQWLPVEGQNQTWSYAHWLRMLWFGVATDWSVDPAAWLDSTSHHLWCDLIHYFHHIDAMAPEPVRSRWEELTDVLLERITESVPRAMSIGTSMSQYIRIAKSLGTQARIVEVGSFHGGSVVTLAVALLHRGIELTSVESFLGNGDGTVDGHALSKPAEYLAHIKGRYPHLNIRTYPLDSVHAARKFDNGSLDMVFIDGDHRTSAVLRDIDTWLPKLRPGGILAGDDIGWDGVRSAVDQKFGLDYQATDEVWWTTRK